MSSSQIIDGIIVMFTLNRIITPEVAAGIFVIGIMSGLALMLITIYSGQYCGSAIYEAKTKPENLGLPQHRRYF